MAKNWQYIVSIFNIYVWPYRLMHLIVLISILLEAIFIAILPFGFKTIIDQLAKHNGEMLIIILSALLLAAILISIVGLIKDLLYTRFIANLMRDLRSKLFCHLENLPMGFFLQSKTGDILTYFTTDLRTIEFFALSLASNVIFPIVSFICNFLLLIYLDWKLALFSLVIWPTIFIGPKKIAKKLVNESFQMKAMEVQLLSITQENVGMQSVIRTFGLSDYLTQIFATANKDLTGKLFSVNFLNQLVGRWAEAVPIILQLITLGIAVYMAYHDLIPVSSLIAFYMGFGTLIFSLIRITYCIPSLVQGAVSIERVSTFLNEPTETNAKETYDIESFKEQLCFENVSFSFVRSEPILQDIHCTINKGEKVAFVGPSGSGKSTILKLLICFYDVNEGTLTIDHKNYDTLSRTSLRRLIGYVPQEPLLFHTSIRQNIQFGKMDASFEDIQEAAKAAEIHDTIMSLPNGYETMLSERGDNLSGGQKQRLAIARVILREPQILILDETTSALDPASEVAINTTLDRLSKGRTSISVTHRLDSVVYADKIIVLDKGKIIEQGTHTSLIAANGFYKMLWDKQHGFFVDNTTGEISITLERLKAIPLFKNLPDDILEKNRMLFKTVSLPAHRAIIEQGDIGNTFYIIVHGRVDVFQKQGEDINKIAVLEEGDYFGEIALLKTVPRTASVKTLSPCLLLTLYQRDFIQLLNEAPDVKKEVEKILLERT